jgi:hypothetical protein
MLCPNCNAALEPWPWQDGGYKGVQCPPCALQWWSNSFESRAHEVAEAAVRDLIASSSFPTDAGTDPEWFRTPDPEAPYEGEPEH